jgi:calpain-15
VNQGALGDCWFCSAMSIVAQHSLLLRSLFVAFDVAAGLYTVRLYLNGAWQLITIDDYIPVDNADNKTPLFAHAVSRRELWVPLSAPPPRAFKRPQRFPQ